MMADEGDDLVMAMPAATDPVVDEMQRLVEVKQEEDAPDAIGPSRIASACATYQVRGAARFFWSSFCRRRKAYPVFFVQAFAGGEKL